MALYTSMGYGQEILPLYNSVIPNSKPNDVVEEELKRDDAFFGYKNVTIPNIALYKPDNPDGRAVIICPGGGYGMESYLLEGIRIAESMTKQGITAFILKYRLPNKLTMVNTAIGPLQDAQQAIKMVRENAEKWNIHPDKIGMMGFSAGGHLASTAGTHFQKSYIDNPNNTSLRPDFMILVYPVISMQDSLTHMGSRNNLLGKNPDRETIELFSNELQVNASTPTTWITHTGDDTVVDVENSIQFYQRLIRHGIEAEMHLYPTGNHGFVLSMDIEDWMPSIYKWLDKSVFKEK
ncbi:hypothetical protein GCM10025777_04160 [Membranihabitans marinus]